MKKFLFLTFVFLSLVACSTTAVESNEPQPPEMTYGQDVCASCGMLIDDAHFAAATLMKDGQTRKFDDVGEMMMYHMDHPDLNVEAWFVHDYNTQGWIRGETAYYVMDSQLLSPMGHGIAAFSDRATAVTFAQTFAADVLDFDGLKIAVHIAIHS